jgi:hypothetical protein
MAPLYQICFSKPQFMPVLSIDGIDGPKTYLAHRWRQVLPNQDIAQQLARLLFRLAEVNLQLMA